MLLAGVLAIALIAAGCGSSDSNSTVSLTKVELVNQGDAICKQGGEKVKSETAAYMKEVEPQLGLHDGKHEIINEAQYKHINEAILLPVLQQEAEEIHALGAPQSGAKELEATLVAFEKGIEKSKKVANPILLGTALAKPNKALEKYGFKYCGKN